MARAHRIASHTEIVARYRIHAGNMSHRLEEMLHWHLRVFDKNRPTPDDGPAIMARWRAGRIAARRAYLTRGWLGRGHGGKGLWRERLHMFRGSPLESVAGALKAAALRLVPAPARAWLRAKVRAHRRERRGEVDFGDFARIAPIDDYFGFGRGTPVDRFYIERFLANHAADIRGRVLEVGDDRYTRRFGIGVTGSEVVALTSGQDGSTFTGDICTPGTLPAGAFDCIVAVQTLQYLEDPGRGLKHLHAALRPGGVLLLTAPAISPMIDEETPWLWSFGRHSIVNLLAACFREDSIEAAAWGNAFAATCFVQGIALEDIEPAWLDPQDPARPILITARAVRED